MIIEMLPEKDVALYALMIDEWNHDLSPWEAPAVFGKEAFGDGAGKTLRFIQKNLFPIIQSRRAGEQNIKYYLGGYSLAGLFALWAGYQTQQFKGIAAASPSVWFPRWIEFIQEQKIKSPLVYLSLGDKEEKVKNPVMAKVGENIRSMERILQKSEQCRECVLEWNPGNHFKDIEKRMAKAFAWVIQRNGKELSHK